MRRVVRHAVRAGVESYSIKRLEPLYEFERETGRRTRTSRSQGCTALELGDVGDIAAGDLQLVHSYNRDDCVSTI
jgi:predicted RecB family nuclease